MALYFPNHEVLFTHLPKTGGRFCRYFFTEYLKLKHINVCDFHSPAIMCGYKYINTKSFHFVRGYSDWLRSYIEWKGRDKILQPCEPHLKQYHPTWLIDRYIDNMDTHKLFNEYENMIKLFSFRSKPYEYNKFHENLSLICKEYFNIDISVEEISNLKVIK